MTDPADLRASVADFRSADTPDRDRAHIRAYWDGLGLPHQFAVLQRAAEIEREAASGDQ